MRTNALWALALTSLAACTAITNPGQYRGRDGAVIDGGPRDGGDGGGACEPACADGETCVDGECRCGTGAACDLDQACCEDQCVPLDSVTDCNACGNACPAVDHGTPVCTETGCSFVCDDGWGDCNGIEEDGCEQDLVSAEHCGECNAPCAVDTEVCGQVGGVTQCTSACDPGFTPCSGACVDLATSVSHCGACGQVCPDPDNASASCTDSNSDGLGECGVSCDLGFGDCDGNVLDGCEPLVPYYPDLDADGFGDGSAAPVANDCPGRTVAGAAERAEDCDDSLSSVRPMGTEVCDGRDNDCDTDTDEGFGVGELCGCTTGAVLGRFACEPSSPTMVACMYPAEVCNGLDDDCEGTADNGFACVRGGARSCTIAGCSTAGVQTCNLDCSGFGACVITELCDRVDNDCDGSVDEGALAALPVRTVAARGVDPRTATHAARREVGVVYGVLNAESTHDVFFARMGTDGSTLGSPVLVVTQASSWDIAFDGVHWTVAVTGRTATTGRVAVRTFRVESATDRVFGGVDIEAFDGTHTPAGARVARIAGRFEVAVVWLEQSGTLTRARGARVSAPSSASALASVLGSGFDVTALAENPFRDAAVITTQTGASAYFVRTSTTPIRSEILEVPITSTGFGGPNAVLDDPSAITGLDGYVIFAASTIGLVYQRGTVGWSLVALSTSGTRLWDVDLGARRRVSIEYAGDMVFGLAMSDAGPGTSTLERRRASDGALVGTPLPLAGEVGSITGFLAGSPGRYVVVTSGADLGAQAIDCR